MSTTVNIARTIFQSVDEAGNITSTTYGIRVYDEHEAHYSNLIASLEELKSMSADDLVDFAKDINSNTSSMIIFAEEMGDVIVDGVSIVSGPSI